MLWNFILMVMIGAIIGGVTNYLAIKMLFRPYKRYQIGKWTIPFTPGLIPKRHDEIAEQLGRVVEEYLVTEELLREWIRTPETEADLQRKVQKSLERSLAHSEPLINLMEDLPPFVKSMLEKEVGTAEFDQSIWMRGFSKWLKDNGERTIEEIIPLNPVQVKKISSFIADHLIEQIIIFLLSYQGRRSLKEMAESFLKPKSSMFQFISNLFFNEERVIDMLLPRLIESLNQSEVKHRAAQQIENVLSDLIRRKLCSYLGDLNEEQIAAKITEMFPLQTLIHRFLHKPVKEWGQPIYQTILPKIPMLTSWILDRSAEQVSRLYKSLNLATLVSRQVKSFPLQKLEELIISIAAKELKAITYLGALLGGFIGSIQYLLLKL